RIGRVMSDTAWDKKTLDIHCTKPGAVHQARWMARNMKMYMFLKNCSIQLQYFLALFHTNY
ncbi:Hypothetical protein FKW44_021935, partial [Caligus rogercresseyi]